MSEVRVAVTSGDGLVRRAGEVVMVVLDPARAPALTGRLLAAVDHTPPERLFRALGRMIIDADAAPAFGVLVGGADEASVFLHGDIGFRALLGGTEIAGSGGESATWLERSLPGPVTRLGVGSDLTAPADEPWTDLREGTAPGSAAWILTAAAPSTDASPATPVPSRAEEAGVAAASAPPPPPPPPPSAPAAPTDDRVSAIHVDLAADPALLAARTPLPRAGEPAPNAEDEGPAPPTVKGIRCPVDHHNNPAASYCSSCGRKLGISRSLVLVDGPRPPLGVLILDDGSTIPIQFDLVIGRDPDGDDLVQHGSALPVGVADGSQSVSRSHLHIQLEQWDVIVSDRGSSNGTFVWDDAAGDWRRLRDAERLRIEGGTRLLMGQREVVFDQHHVRAP